MIRYYEQTGLIPEAVRSDAGYRHYRSSDVHSLRFICRARDLGFSVEQISGLLVLWHDRGRASADVKAVALAHAAGLKAKIAELQSMLQTLEHLANHCHGNDRPDCPILTDLAETNTGLEQEPWISHKAPRFGVDTPASSRQHSANAAHS